MTDRFWDKVDRSGDCWIWTASLSNGYGQYWLDGKLLRAHRVAYEMLRGPIPDGLLLDHLCHTLACVNPDHLRLATTRQNAENRAGAQSNSGSGLRGVHWNRQKQMWHGEFVHNGRKYHVGFFADKEDAGAAVARERSELHDIRPLRRTDE